MNKNNKFWICTEYFSPDISSATGYFLTEIAYYLKKKVDIRVITATSKSFITNPNYYKKEDECIKIIRLKGGNINKKIFFKRSIKFLYLSIQYFFILLIYCKKNDKILVVTNPAPLVIIGALIKTFKKIEYTILAHDVFPENMIALGLINKNSIVYKILAKSFNWGYSKSDKIICIGNDMRNVFEKKITTYQGQLHVIYNWSDIDNLSFAEKEKNIIIQNNKLQDKLVVTYAGNIGRAQGIQELLDCILSVSINKNVHFLFFGKGALENEVRQKTKEAKNITFLGSLSRNDKNIFLTAADISIVTLSKNMVGLGVPSKTYDIMGSGRPILFIGDLNSDIAKLIEKYDIGWNCEPTDFIRFNEIIDIALKNTNLILKKGEKAREIAQSIFAKEIILKKYEEILLC